MENSQYDLMILLTACQQLEVQNFMKPVEIIRYVERNFFIRELLIPANSLPCFLSLHLTRRRFVGGAILLCLVAVVCAHTARHLGNNWLIMQRRWPQYLNTCRSPYPEMGYRAMGRGARLRLQQI
ncbi:unnamed protein product [Strongylus vulgaris]|uniref:Uncharacterized protein n=1 Tax=Strongylus vulgaris TaxID=40348 RepID=A0A3P7L3K3_STRVU|nr:unnamed protein product [Strongylus vulgaris]